MKTNWVAGINVNNGVKIIFDGDTIDHTAVMGRVQTGEYVVRIFYKNGQFEDMVDVDNIWH